MTITLEFSPEIEASLTELAAAHGLTVPDLVRRLLEERLRPRDGAGLSVAERLAAWGDLAKGLPLRPPLSDEAIARAGLYEPRG